MQKRLVLLGGAVIAAIAVGAGVLFNLPQPTIADLPEVVLIPADAFSYRPAGEFRIGTRVVDAPVQQRKAKHSFEIMKYAVSQSDYSACVADKACDASLTRGTGDTAQIGINYFDATAYATWLSKRTGSIWRLPTDEEWVRAAGDRFNDDALGEVGGSDDPSERWLANYLRATEIRGDVDSTLRAKGEFGENNLGVADISGNIWEWTETCFQNGKVSEDGLILLESNDYCGVRSVQGKHRAFIIDFVRDARVGGCAVGLPPDYLGFRLVHEIGS